MFSDMWQFDTSQDQKVLGDDFDNISSDTIPNNILQALSFHFSPLAYLKKRVLQFVDITNNTDLTIEPVDNGQPITDSKDEKVRKQNKRAVKRKTQLNNLHASEQAPATSFAALLLSYSASVFCFKSFAPLLSCLRSLTYFLSYLMPAPIPESLAVLLLFLVFGPALLYLAFTVLRTFK